MTRLLLIPLLLAFQTYSVKGQWCVPTTAIPYASTMPGITHFVLNTIDRTSLDLENYPNNSYVNTGLSTELHPGETYSVSITYTIDASICPDMNLRVWIDYNKDYQLDDVGETVLSVDNQLPGTYTGSFTVPVGTPLQSTRLRVTAKMSPSGGHTLPTPCDVPADPLGYHGEIEDYEVDITAPTSVSEIENLNLFSAYYSNGDIHFSASNIDNETSIGLYDINGKLVNEVLRDQNISGNYMGTLNCSESNIVAGIYLAVLTNNESKKIVRLVID